MKNSKKLFSGLLTLGFLLSSVAALKTQDARFSATHAASLDGENAQLEWTDADFADETIIDEEFLNVTLTQSTTTENSQLYNINFKAKSNIGFYTKTRNFIVQINDSNFSGNLDNPVKEDAEDSVEKYTFIDDEGKEVEAPLFNSVISYISGSKDETDKSNKNVYIPSYVVRKHNEHPFAMKVTTILSGATTKKGSDDYRNKNTWMYRGRVDGQRVDLPQILEIFIPHTVDTIEANAFTDVPTQPEDPESYQVPVKLHYEGLELPANCDENWTDAPAEQIDVSEGNYKRQSAKTGEMVDVDKEVFVLSLDEDIGEAENFIVGYKQNEFYPGQEYNKPLVIEYNSTINGVTSKKYKSLDVTSVRNSYDGVGSIGSLSFGRSVIFDLAKGEEIDDDSIVIHNIYDVIDDADHFTYTIDLTPGHHYKAIPKKTYKNKTALSYLVNVDHGNHSTFCGYTRYSLYLSKNLKYTTPDNPTERSYYLDVKDKIYATNKASIDKGETYIRYSLYNLYKAIYRFYYLVNNEVKYVDFPLTLDEGGTYLPSGITYQTLDRDNGNVVACLVKDSDIKALAPDYSTSRLVKFEIRNLTIQMDLFKSAGTATIIGKSAAAFTFGCVTAIDYNGHAKAPFNFNLLVGIFAGGFIVVYALLAVGLYFFRKNKYKNDEFRRVNTKKYVKSAIIGGLGATIFALAVLFIIIRFSGFRNTVVTYNPADPFVILFSIAGIIAFGYFVVVMVKTIKAEKERRKHIRLRLDEDVDDDGTN